MYLYFNHRGLCSSKKEEEAEDEDKGESKLEIHLFSITTLYYVVSIFTARNEVGARLYFYRRL